MQREISISSGISTLPFNGEYDFAPSMYSSIFPPKDSSILENYLHDGSSNFSSTESENALAPKLPQFQQLLNQDLTNRHRMVMSRLRGVAKEAQTLRQENVNLKMANLDLYNRLNRLHNSSPFRGADADPGLDNLVDRLLKMDMEDEGTSENEAVAQSPTSVMDSGQGGLGEKRVHLPKSISVRSNGYLKAARAGGSGGGSGRDGPKVVKASTENNGTQKVYVKGGEQAVELEVYNQGMFKTELCNKWQQTGACPYGDNCQFAHGIAELRPVLRHPRYKTEVCRMFLTGVPCPYGHRCHFRHTLTEEEQLVRAMNSNSLQPMSYR
ncbi:zinc finger CCCH domain-containing protein 15-like [Salvia miltiorrhiza]|uniref:zinc finger CCCH domain-containing protein 15-like n=1 Tax=Salvia miltiorrhiza TaxID=226208 RepID=UPI0025ABB5F3|nr:zinc finger CCCH domain-containing protein 15-like [Salvia miltiorrhiza]XP_057765865.1 zinc finger CCCH domain-containing protein 15-like [Salvia miltiorrhiza]